MTTGMLNLSIRNDLKKGFCNIGAYRPKYRKQTKSLTKRNKPMTTQQAITILRQHNQWRRVGGSVPLSDPKLVGEAIDVAIVVMEIIASGIDTVESK